MYKEFENDLITYYYIDISTALQINECEIVINEKQTRVVLINYDLHKQNKPTKALYGVAVPNDDCINITWK